MAMFISCMFEGLPADVARKFDYRAGLPSLIDGISIIIPFRGGDRFGNLRACLMKILQQNIDPIEIILSEEDKESKIHPTLFAYDPRVRHVFNKSERAFNKAFAVNAGVAAARYNACMMNDVDIILPNGFIAYAATMLKEYESCFLGKTIYNMLSHRLGFYTWKGSLRSDYFTGGNITFRKDAFIKIGGMCEKFCGYGSEDCEFWTRISKLTKMKEEREWPLLHLHHRREHVFSTNTALYDSITNQSMDQRIEELSKDLEKHFPKI